MLLPKAPESRSSRGRSQSHLWTLSLPLSSSIFSPSTLSLSPSQTGPFCLLGHFGYLLALEMRTWKAFELPT